MLDKKKVLEMYAYYLGALRGAPYLELAFPKIKTLKLTRGMVQRAYNEIKELKLDMGLVEFLYLVDFMYLLIITKELGCNTLAEIGEMIENKIDEKTKNNFVGLIEFSKPEGADFVEDFRKRINSIIRTGYEKIYGGTIEEKELEEFKNGIKFPDREFMLPDGRKLIIKSSENSPDGPKFIIKS